MGEARRKRNAAVTEVFRDMQKIVKPSRVCPVTRIRCYSVDCRIVCQDTQSTKGEPYMVHGQLGHLPNKEACRECPMRRNSIAGYLGGYSVENYLAILHSDAEIACHMSPGFHTREREKQRGCTGVSAYRANVSKMPRGDHARESVELIGPNREDFFATPQEFADHHKDAVV